MVLTETEAVLATKIYGQLITGLSKAKNGSKRWWEFVSMMQELANKGLPDAEKYMTKIDLSKAPELVNKTWSTRLLEGPPSTSFKGQRRQLQADPKSPHKTFGMRPHRARGDDLNDQEI